MQYKAKTFFTGLTNFLSKPYLVILGGIVIAIMVIPMLFYNIKGDPRLVPYFDHDEGYGRDLAWYYYSGQKTETFQYGLDYGVEYQLIVDFFVRPLGLFIPVDQGVLLLVIRLFHFICGVLALIFLWKFLKRHFPSFWMPTVCVLALVISPHFVWWLDNVKPEPLLVLLVILGLDYTLRIIEEPPWKNLILATFFSSVAFMIKLIGLFLLPGVLLSFYLVPLIKKESINKQAFYRILKSISMISIFLLICLLAILSVAVPIGSKIYLKMKIENFDLEKFASSFEPARNISLFVNMGIVLLLISCMFLILWLRHKNSFSLFYKKISILPLFIIFFVLIGYRWSFNLFEGGITYARWLHQQKVAPLNLFMKPSILQAVKLFINNIVGWVKVLVQNDVLGVTGLILVALYFIIELFSKSWRKQTERIRFFKRMVILSYCIIFMFFVFLFQSRQAPHHLTTVNILFLLLGFEGLRLLFIKIRDYKRISWIVIFCAISIVSINFWQRGLKTVTWRLNKIKQKCDIVYTIGQWWKDNYPYDIKIVADAPTHIYIPSEFKNVVFVKPRLFLDLSFKINPKYTEKIIEREKPRVIFYNEGTRGGELSPSVSQFLKDIHLKKIKEFKGDHFGAYHFRDDCFIVYELPSD